VEEFLLSNGYWILATFLFAKSIPFAGGLFSGNTALYISALLAGLGEFRLSVILVIGFTAVLLGDSLMFIVGKYFSNSIPFLKKVKSRVQPWIDKVHEGDNKIINFYMHTGLLRAYLPFFFGYSKMSNQRWLRQVVLSSMLFIPIVTALGFIVGKLDISGTAKAVMSGILWLSSVLVFTQVGGQLFKTARLK